MSNFKYEVERLNKAVNELRGKLFESEAENQKLKLELECVLELLKKAWSGDRIASMHITNILNNAEITNLKQQSFSSETGLAQQSIVDKQQRENLLKNRNEYLNQEFMKTATTMGSMPVSCNTSQTMSRPSSSVLRRPMSTNGTRAGSARSLGLSRRTRSAVGGERQLVGGFNAGDKLQMIQANERLELFGLKPTNTGTRYDDPNRYMKDGLYSANPEELKITGKPGSLSTVPFVYAQGLHPHSSPRVQAAQAIAARRQGKVNAVQGLAPNTSKRPPSGILAVHDRPLKSEVNYYEATLQSGRRVSSGHQRKLPGENSGDEGDGDSARVRPKSSNARGIRFADDVDVHSVRDAGSNDGTASNDGHQSPVDAEERKRRATVAIQRRIGISDNAIVLPR